MNPRKEPEKGPQPVVVQVERPRTRDLEPSTDRALSRLGAAVTVLLSIGGGFGAVVKTYNQVDQNKAELGKQEKAQRRLERRLRGVQKDLRWLCLKQLDPTACYSIEKGIHATDEE